MKISKIFAGMSAAAMIAAITIPVSAANSLDSVTVESSSKPDGSGHNYIIDPIADVEGITADNAADVDKIVVGLTGEAFFNGTIGGNTVSANGWANAGQIDTSDAGAASWTWDEVGGLLVEDGTANVQVQIWWMNAVGDDETGYSPATVTIDSISFYDVQGNLIGSLSADNMGDVDTEETTTTTAADETTTTTTTTAADETTTTTTTTTTAADETTTTTTTTTTKAGGAASTTTTKAGGAASTTKAAATTSAAAGSTTNAATGSSASAAFAAAGVALAGAAIVAAKKNK